MAWLLGVLLCLGQSRVSAGTPAAGPPRRNFLFVYLDDQRWDAMQFFQRLQGAQARFPWLKTPNIDRLAAQSVWLRNTFATDSLCSPSRASFLTGQYPHMHGVVNNHQALPLDSVTYATLLRAAGYHTGFVGKWHMGQQAERPGFDYSASFLGQGEYYHCSFLIDGGKQTVVSDKWVDDTTTDYAVDFLRQHQTDGPFVLAVAFKSVHGPLQPNTPDLALYRGEAARPVPNLEVPSSFQAPYHPRPFPRDLRPVIPYLECLAGADRDLGRLLDTLDTLGLAQNTMVIFTSDNGFALGEHELYGKRTAYEESMRIPCLVRAPFIPGTAGKVADQMALNIDIAPTMLDYAGVLVPKAMQGRSLRPLLEQKSAADWSRAFLYEHFFQKNALWPTMVGVRTDDAKLVDYPNHPDWTEVFQLDRDPYEVANLAGKPEARTLQTRLEAELTRLRNSAAYVVPGDSDKDTYADDAAEDMRWRQNFPDRPMSGHPHTAAGADDRD